MPAFVAPLIAMGGSILSEYLSKDKGPPGMPEADWIGQYGPPTWNALREQGMGLMEDPQGLGKKAKAGMQRDVRATSSSGYESGKRANAMSISQMGLSPGGGESARRDFLAARGFAEDVGRGLSQIEILDFQAKEAQRARGENLLINLTRNAPAYAQLAAQNYWNMVAQDNLYSQAIGQGIGSAYDLFLQGQEDYEDPYSTGSGSEFFTEGGETNNFSDPNVTGNQGNDSGGFY